MTDHHNEAGCSEENMTDQKKSGGWQNTPSRINSQALASENHSEAMQRWIRESIEDGPWNGIGSFRQTATGTMGNTSRGEKSTNGATAGSKTSASGKQKSS